jgi:predicted lipoprotein
MKRIGLTSCCLLLAGAFFWFFPLFHVVHIDNSSLVEHETDFNAADFAKMFWKNQLTPSLTQAPDAAAVLAALGANAASARTNFGRKVGVSRASLYVVRGSGSVVSVDKKGIGVALGDESKRADVLLQTGLLFGNTVRDATGLLDASNFSDSRQFNEVSTELNRIAEAEVLSPLKHKATVGGHITFAGCMELPDESEISRPLNLIPLQARID